jgi:Flp pilus assembly protein TadG
MRIIRSRKSMSCGRSQRLGRRGATVVEMALITPLLLLTLIGLIILGLGIFRCNQVACLAHEGARWAAVRGKTYDKLHNRASAVTSTDLYNDAIKPRAVGFDPQKLTSELTWSDDRRTVAVTVRYRWVAEAFFGEMSLSSTSTALVSN